MSRNVWSVLGCLGLLQLSQPSYAYNTDIHRILTLEAVARSTLSSGAFVQDLGASAAGYTATDGTANLTLPLLISQGAHLEDEADPVSHPSETRRFCNHFFDPQFASFTGRGLDDFGGRGLPSPDWALEDRFTVTTVADGGSCNPATSPAQRPQDFSYRDALDAIYKALTYSDASARHQQFGRTFQILGQVVHHLQDTTAPVTVTAGTHQQVSLVTTITNYGSPGFSCTGNGNVFWNDRAGKHFVSGNPSWISIQ
jgi:hypothetical protein